MLGQNETFMELLLVMFASMVDEQNKNKDVNGSVMEFRVFQASNFQKNYIHII